MAGNDVFLYGVTNADNDVRLTDPNNPASSSVSFSSATTDGADVLAAAVGPVVGLSSATTDGADVLAAVVAPVSSGVDFSSATTDGADVLASVVGPVIGLASATTDGADTLTAVVTPQAAVVDISSATTDGADVLLARIANSAKLWGPTGIEYLYLKPPYSLDMCTLQVVLPVTDEIILELC